MKASQSIGVTIQGRITPTVRICLQCSVCPKCTACTRKNVRKRMNSRLANGCTERFSTRSIISPLEGMYYVCDLHVVTVVRHALTPHHAHTHTHVHAHTHTCMHTPHTRMHMPHTCMNTPRTLMHTPHTRMHTPHTYTHTPTHTLSLYLSRPKSDTCKTCDHLNVRISAEEDPSERDKQKFELQLHQCRADRAYQQLKEDTALSKASPDVDMFTFDLQQSLPTPKISTSIVFYKRQLWTYNFGIHSCSDGKGYMFMWPECVASRGSFEICSSILKYLQLRTSDATHLIVYSDACCGQNRNINVACLWMYVVCCSDFSYTKVDHKFMVSGHSYLLNDRDVGSIEKANRRTQSVYTPEQWYSLVETARSKNPFRVTPMNQDDFVTLAAVRAEIVYRKVNTLKEKVEWLRIRWIRITKDKPFQIQYKYSHNDLECWKILDVHRRKRGQPSDPGRLELQPLYTRPRPIKENKLKDLLELLDYIPPIHQGFYSSLPSSSTARSDTESENESECASDED